MGSHFYYSNQDIPETWTEETAWYEYEINDSLVERTRIVKVTIANPLNMKEDIYTSYRRCKVVENLTNQVIFLGRVELVETNYDDTYGQVLIITLADYIQELFERPLSSDYSAQPVPRSQLVLYIVDDYTYPGTVTEDIETSGNTQDLVAKNYTNSNMTAIQAIEDLAAEDFWTDDLFQAVWVWDGSKYTDVTSLAQGGGAFPILVAGSELYLGQNNPFLGANIGMFLPAANSITNTWLYYSGTGTGWVPLVMTQTYNFNSLQGSVGWEVPKLWENMAFSDTVPHAATPPDPFLRYWVRCEF